MSDYGFRHQAGSHPERDNASYLPNVARNQVLVGAVS